MKKRMHLLFEDVLRPNKYLMSTFGVWPMPTNVGAVFKAFTFIRIILAMSFLSSLVVPQMYHLKINWGNINIMADTGCLVLVFILIIFKFYYMTIRQRSFCTVYQHLREFWDISDDEVERRSYEDFALMAKLVTIIAIVSGSGNFVSFLAAALIPMAFNRHQNNETTHHRILPLDIAHGFNIQKTPNFELLFITQTIGLFFCTTGAVGGDCTMMTIVLHVSGQFRFIATRFRIIGRNVEEAIYCNNDKAKIEVTKMISACIAHHQLVIGVAKKVSGLLSPMVFGQMLTSGLEICLSGYAVMEGDNSGADLVKFCIFLVSMMVQLFVWCWPGELLIQESNAVADSIWYNVPWFLLPSRQQRDLCFVILRAQKECQIATAFQVMSIQKLSEVLKAAGSYMALLRTIKEK